MVLPAPLKIPGGLLAVGLVGWWVLEAGIRRAAVPEGLLDPPAAAVVMLDSEGVAFHVGGLREARDSRPVGLAAMGKWLPAVTVGIEDHRFYQHSGVDFVALTRAAARNLAAGRAVSGASTITQQLVKLRRGRVGPATWQGKLEEALAAVKAEREFAKDEILEAYLNRLDYGNRRVGPEAAAWAYFGKPSDRLTLAEAIYLAGLPRSPTLRNPWINREGAAWLYRHNVRRLARAGILPDGVDVDVLAATVPTVGRYDPPMSAPHYASAALGNMPAPRGVVETFLDPALQALVDAAVVRHLGGAAGFTDAAVVVVENATRRVLAVGGSGGGNTANPAQQRRSAGSTLKPFLYAQSLDSGELTAASLLPDTPDAVAEEYRDYAPRNYSRRYRGPVRLREALANSLNVPAVSVLAQLGARPAFHRMKAWGLGFPGGFDAYGAGFILGNAPVSAVELAGAYSALARGGVVRPLRWAATQPAGEISRPVAEAVARIIGDILADPVARASSFGRSSPLNLGWPAAVKTGTSSGFRDGWCAGFDGDHTVVVWVGSLSGRPMPGTLAVRSAAPLWAAVMAALHERGSRPLPPLSECEGMDRELVSLPVSRLTGLLPEPGEDTIVEWFVRGTVPTGKSAAMFRDGRLVLPPEYSAWCASAQNDLGAVTEGSRLKILHPREGEEFLFQRHLPPSRQVLVAKSTEDSTVWTLNGSDCPGGRIPLVPGNHVLQAAADGQTDEVRFTVAQ